MTLGNLVQIVPQHGLAEVVAASQACFAEGNRITKVYGDRLLLQYEGLKILCQDGWAEARGMILGGECCHVHWPVGGVERWSIRKIELSKVVDGQLSSHCSGDDIYALVHSNPSRCLGTKNLFAFLVKNQHQAYFLRSWEVSCMACFVHNHCISIDTCILSCFQVQANRSCHRFKNLDDGSTADTLVGAMGSQGILGSQSALPIGRAGKRHADSLSEYSVSHLGHITGCIDEFIASPHLPVDLKTTRFSNDKTGVLCNLQSRSYANGEQYEIGINSRTIVEQHLRVLDSLEGFAELEFYPIVLQLFGDEASKLPFQVRHHLLCHLHQRNADATLGEGFYHLKSDEPTTYDNRFLRLILFNVVVDPVHVCKGP
ncbi:hypothetical protein SDC9_79983 [bioreactor metagenome]|uniref:Uncharacterized protein n=1 Tax=bioreactor metagenome TaxID=1076179 RepID=A0A644YZD3_9ZZZZ